MVSPPGIMKSKSSCSSWSSVFTRLFLMPHCIDTSKNGLSSLFYHSTEIAKFILDERNSKIKKKLLIDSSMDSLDFEKYDNYTHFQNTQTELKNGIFDAVRGKGKANHSFNKQKQLFSLIQS